MSIIKEKFKFLDDGIDIPFYNDNPKLSTFEWLILLAAVLLVIGYLTVIPISNDYLSIAVFLTCTIPALYICKGNYSLFFKKLRLKDIKIIILCVIAIYVYAGIIRAILAPFTEMPVHAGFQETITLITVINMFLEVMGEEFFKIFILLLVMYVIYKLTGNRNMSIITGLFVSMTIFGLAHYYAYDGKILQILLLQGLGSIFAYLAYLKTKNIWVTFLAHLIQNLIPVTAILLHLIPVG